MVVGIYSNLYYTTRWVPLKRRRLGWPKCNKIYVKHNCVASCGLIDSRLEIVLDLKGCNLDCKYCWGWKMRYLSQDIKKSPYEVVRDILCRAHWTIKDKLTSKSKYRLGVIRFTGNEPTLQWKHLIEVLKILDNFDVLIDLCKEYGFCTTSAELVHNSKVIIETNGISAGIGNIDLEDLLEIENLEIDIDVSFKGVNDEQFEWLSSRPRQLFNTQIDGFIKLFDFSEGLRNVNVNPVLGINHAPNYCVWCKGERYIMDVEIIDRNGKKLDFTDFSKEFEEEVLSRKDLRYDEAPFREYFGINRDRTRLVVAVVYKGRRYLHVLPSEIPLIAKMI